MLTQPFRGTKTISTSQTRRRASVRQLTGVALLAIGRIWAVIAFAPGTPWWTPLALCLPILILAVLVLGAFLDAGVRQPRGAKRGWAIIGLHIYAGLSFVLAVGSIVAGQIGADVHFFGVKSIAELVPTAVIGLGGMVWLTTLLHLRSGHTTSHE